MSISKHNLLVMAVGSPLGQSIVKALHCSSLPIKIHAADISKLAAGLYLPSVIPIILPQIKDPNYLNTLTAYIREHKIQSIFPVIALEHAFFENNAAYFHKMGVEILSCSAEVYKLCNDKFQSMIHLREMGVRAPDTSLCASDDDVKQFLVRNRFPVFIKPRFGASSSDIFKIHNEDQLIGILRAFPSDHFIIQSYLDDPRDFTAGVYVSRDRSFQSTILIERELKFGLSYRGAIFEDEALSKYCLDIAEAISSNYSINVQFKVVDGLPYVYEINPRLSSTTCVRAHFGFNEPEMILHEIQGRLNNYVIKTRSGRFTRYWQEHYLEGE